MFFRSMTRLPKRSNTAISFIGSFVDMTMMFPLAEMIEMPDPTSNSELLNVSSINLKIKRSSNVPETDVKAYGDARRSCTTSS